MTVMTVVANISKFQTEVQERMCKTTGKELSSFGVGFEG
jgi:hypothetical protein